MEKRAGNRGTSCLGASVLALALFGWLASYAVRGEPRLLDRSNRLIDASFWSQDFGSYFWENDHSVLTFRPEGKSERAVSVDVFTRTETPRAALSSAIAGGGTGVRSWRLSPDGRRLLWCDLSNQVPAWTATELNGTCIKRWKNTSFGFLPLWLPDSRRWFGAAEGNRNSPFVTGSEFGVYDVVGPSYNLKPTPGPSRWPIGVTPNNHIVSLQWVAQTASGNGAVEWFEYSLEPKPTAGPHGKAVMPRTAVGVTEAELSPDGSLIATLVQYSYLSPLEQILGQYLHVPVTPRQKVGLWIVNRDRCDATLVGSEEGPAPFGLLWTPDGNRLSFIQNGSLYSVKVPRR